MEPASIPAEGWTVAFFDGMEEADSAVKSMTAMLNRFNKATVVIKARKDGRTAGEGLSEKDVDAVLGIISARTNRMPDVRVTLESDGDERYIKMVATGYETPYAFDGWFYTRK